VNAHTSKPVVIVVDDSPESIDVIRGVLGDEYRVRVAISGSIALGLAEKSPPDLILLDVMMPAMTGFEVCRRLKSNPATERIPIIFMTTLADEGFEARGLELGAVDYITKPYVPSLVRSRVRTHVALHRQNLALEVLIGERTAELLGTRQEIIRRLGRAAEYRDNETGMHVVRMSHIARLIGLHVGMSEADGEILLQAAPMHDVGKIGIPDKILLKPGPLDADEWAIMKRHTIIGAEIIGDHPSALMKGARTLALRHHERWDGTGYPDGLAGEEIPLAARVVAVADVFDALLSVRPYKAAWSVDETVEEIRAQSGRRFEPRCANALLELLPECLEVRAKYRDE
jgi:putative two-component system response regulator